MFLSLVIPAYNEEKRIGKTVAEYIDFLNGKNLNLNGKNLNSNGKNDQNDRFIDININDKFKYEIIVVSDGTDNTKDIIRDFMKSNSNIKLLEFQKRQGKGGAIIRGFKKSRGDIVGFIDADSSVSPQEFKKLLKFIGNYDCVIGSRIQNSTIVNRTLRRKVPSRIFNILVNLLFKLEIKDTQCGGKLFKKDVIDSIELKTKGFEFDVELLWRIKNKGFKIKEVPINWNDSREGTFNLKYSMSMLISLLKIRIWR